MSNTDLNVNKIKNIVSDLAAQYGAERIYLFGSFARGDANDKSDIDLRIDKGSIRGFAMGGLYGDLRDALGREVDLVSTCCLNQKFLNKIKGEEILLYERKG